MTTAPAASPLQAGVPPTFALGRRGPALRRPRFGAATFPEFNPPSGLRIAGVDWTPWLASKSPQLRSTLSPYTGNLSFKLTGFLPFAQTVLAQHPVGYWKCDDVGGQITDYSGNGNHGGAVGSVVYGVDGPLTKGTDRAIQLDGTTAYVQINPAAILNPAAFTIEAACQFSGALATNLSLYDQRGGTSGFALTFELADAGKPKFWLGAGGGLQAITGPAALNDGKWHLIRGVYDGANASLFVDGVLVAGPTALPYVQAVGIPALIGKVQGNPWLLSGAVGQISLVPTAQTADASLRNNCLAGLPGMPVVEQTVTFNYLGVQYAGWVRTVDPDDVDRLDYLTIGVLCQDNTTLLGLDVAAPQASPPIASSNRTVVESDQARIQWLLNSFGRRSITARHVQNLYATVPATDYTGLTLSAAIKSVMAYSGGSFYVDYARDLHTYLDEKVYAPFSLSDTFDGVTSFGFKDLLVPADSIDLVNAWYGVPKASSVPSVADSATVSVSTDPGSATDDPFVMAIFKRAVLSIPIAQVGALGAFLTGTNTAVNPLFGQATTAGDLLVAWVESDSADATTNAAGWVQAVALRTAHGLAGAIWYKPNCGAGEAAPQFTAAGGLGPMTGQLAEFSGAALVGVLDQVASMSAVGTISMTVTAPSPDSGAGELAVVGSHFGWIGNVTTVFSETFNNGFVKTHAGDDGSTNQNHHASHAFAIGSVSGAIARWYTDETSIALYGRKEGSFADSTVTAQSDLDAIGAVKLAQSSTPRQEGRITCWRPGLAVGQRLKINSSLQTLPSVADPAGNYTALIQGIDVDYQQDDVMPEFHVQWSKPTLTLAVQLAQLAAQSTTAPAAPTAGAFRFRAHATGGQAIPATTNTKVQLAALDADPGQCWNAALNRYVAKTAGLYAASFGTNLAAQVGANFYVSVNGSLTTLPGLRFGNLAGAVAAAMSGSDQIYLNVGDYVELWVFVASATSIENGNDNLRNGTYLALALVTTT